MDLGFDTVGNATLVVHDRRPLLATDPWLEGSAYFGSWGLSHEIPAEQRAAIGECPFLWFSHGHPDHLNPTSLALLRGKTILLPDHVGGRIRRDLEAQGENVRVLPDRRWVQLSERVRVLCVADSFQDAILLVDVGGTLVVDLNDASDRGWGRFVRARVREAKRSFLLALASGGDTDLFHFHDESGRLLSPAGRAATGPKLARLARLHGTTDVVPFSSMHRYQRRDSLWARPYTTPVSELGSPDFDAPGSKLHPAFVRVDARTGEVTPLAPAPSADRVLEPEECGDRWSDLLERDEVARVERYFRSFERLADTLGFVRLRVGGREHEVPLGPARRPRSVRERGLTLEAPRASLVSAVDHEVLDDLLIGNFVKVTLHGRWPPTGLYPDFTPWVAKLGDNGRARTRDEVARYLAEYRRRAPYDFLKHRLLEAAHAGLQVRVPRGSLAYSVLRRVYRTLRP